MTDAGVSGDGTQSAKALSPKPAISNAIKKRLVMRSEVPFVISKKELS
jgi:hypothetical protein